ncbi:MAG TPA: nucleotide exchange factor GrpE [Candidatus Wallbacteria bacterium]|nr:MAG: Protein GrpE [bacterium ADurb.Bin243]HPG56259.1 nucleotide exchange factor GrpE [Candidatus Wallbacteria bacterium]
MTDSENNSKNMPQDGGAGDQLKKVQQQLVQKDNLIRLLQAQLKKQKDSPADSSSADHSVILANLEDEIKKLSGELKEKDSEISSFKRDREELGAKYSELESEFNALKKQFEIVSEKQSDAIGESESKLTEELNDKISSLNESLRKKEEEIQKIKYKLESEIAASAKLKEALNENEIKLKQSQLETGSPDAGYATASKIIEKHIKGGKYLPEEYTKMIDLLSGVSHEMAKTIDDKEKEIEKLISKLKKLESSDSQYGSLAEQNKQLEEKVKYLKTISESHVNENYSQFKVLVNHVIQILDEFYDAFNLLNNNDMAGFKTKATAVFEMLKSSLKTVSVFPIATIGEKFNPKLHEVIEFVRSKEHEDDTIVDEALKGYTLNDELLRSARVKVIKNRFKCSACGNISRVGSQFCDSCGNKLETLSVPYKDIKNTSTLYFQTGKIFEEKNMLEKAREYYQQAVTLEPLQYQYLYHLARVLEMLGDYENSIACFKKVSETDPHYEEVCHHIKNIEIKMNIINGIKNIVTYK